MLVYLCQFLLVCTKNSVENCCSAQQQCAFSSSSFSVRFLLWYTSVQSCCPLPLNVYLKISPVHVDHWEKKRREEKRNPERERARDSHRNVWSKPVTGKGHAFLWAEPTVTPSWQMQAPSISHAPNVQYLPTSSILQMGHSGQVDFSIYSFIC